jgi:DNA-binding PadR family transcriptional regulator
MLPLTRERVLHIIRITICRYTSYVEGVTVFTREIKKGSMELLVLGLLEERARHGYEIGKLIESRSGGRLTYSLPSLYPALLKLEARGWIKGRWVEKPGERRRCFYRLTPEGRGVLARQRQAWADHVDAIKLVLEGGDA